MIIKTESGSIYEYDVEGKTLFRLPTEDVKPWTELRRDKEKIEVIEAADIEVGQSAIFILNLRGDGIPTVRMTSLVTEVIH